MECIPTYSQRELSVPNACSCVVVFTLSLYLLTLVCSYLPDVSECGEKAGEFLRLFMSLTGDVGWKLYLSAKGILHTIGDLLSKVRAVPVVHVLYVRTHMYMQSSSHFSPTGVALQRVYFMLPWISNTLSATKSLGATKNVLCFFGCLLGIAIAVYV